LLRRLPLFSIILTLGLLAARVLRAPILSDPTGSPLPESLHLAYPTLHLILAPLFDLWDGVSMLSMTRLKGFVAGLGLLFIAWRAVAAFRRRRLDPDAGPPIGLVRELGALVVGMGLLAAFVAGGMLWHRPMVSLRGVPPNMILADFHSHTNASHDVAGTLMKGFDAEANRRWHRGGGFDAAFITDHNTIDGFPAEWVMGGSTLLCPGIEVSAWRAHIVMLGTTRAIDRAPYVDSLGGVLQLLRDSGPRHHGLAIASLPEYDRNHWSNLDALIQAGIAGFEIVNASPKANDFIQARRDSIIALARQHDLLLLAVTDSHGWGATVLAWNLVRIPGWQPADPGACGVLIRQLQAGGSEAVQIAERHHLRRESWWPWILTPAGVVWESWRSLSMLQVVSWIVWIWIVGLVRAYRRA
jgi:hypothetical protein